MDRASIDRVSVTGASIDRTSVTGAAFAGVSFDRASAARTSRERPAREKDLMVRRQRERGRAEVDDAHQAWIASEREHVVRCLEPPQRPGTERGLGTPEQERGPV